MKMGTKKGEEQRRKRRGDGGTQSNIEVSPLISCSCNLFHADIETHTYIKKFNGKGIRASSGLLLSSILISLNRMVQ